MFGKGIPLFRLFGFSVKLDWSWLILFVLITWSLAAGTFPMYFKELTKAAYLSMGIAGALGLFFSIVFHELGHSLIARRCGVEMRGITLFIFGGVAEMKSEPPSAMAEFAIAIAGPVVSALIGLVCLAAGYGGRSAGLSAGIYGVLMYLGWINLVLVAFNMIPAFPLDGGRVLRALLWRARNNLKSATRTTAAIGSGFGIMLIVLGVLSFIGGNFVGGMWWFLLGMFLRGAAQMSYQQLIVRRALEGESVRRFMQSRVETVPPTATLEEFVDDYVYRHHFKMFPVAENGKLLGCMTTRKLKEMPRDQWSQHTVSEIAEPCSDDNTIDADADATVALAKMSSGGQSRLMVTQDGQLSGIVSLKDLMKFIALKVELEGDS